MQSYKIDQLLNIPITVPENESKYERTNTNENDIGVTSRDYELKMNDTGIFNKKLSSRIETERNSMPLLPAADSKRINYHRSSPLRKLLFQD